MTHIERLAAHFADATRRELINGMDWYKNAFYVAKQQYALHNRKYSIKQVIGVMAALSPRNKWERNKLDTYNLMRLGESHKVCTFNHQKNKALAIMQLSRHATSDDIENILIGTKTVNFYRNILHRGKDRHITVDVWAFRSLGLNPSPKNYKTVEYVYEELADVVGLTPPQLQAVVWGVVRGKLD